MREVFTKEKKHFCFKCESPCNTKLSSICFPSKNHLLYIVFSQAPPVSTMTHFSVVFNCGLTSDINSMLILTIIQGTMLSWYKNFLIDLNAAKQLSSFNIWWQKLPRCWVTFDSLTPACQQLTSELHACWKLVFSDHLSVTELLSTW